ncbi:TPA: hypothetical protein LTV80_000927 [Clostridioides difficile]|nr:hypothetical protein [Clostridioides difficile]
MDSNKGELSKEIKYSLEQIEKNLKKTEKCIENIYNHLGKIKKRDSEEYDKTTQGELTPRAINENSIYGSGVVGIGSALNRYELNILKIA